MKKRKILYLFPLAALILSGCTFQEGWETFTGFMGENVVEPVKGFFENIFGRKSENKKDEKKDEESKDDDPGIAGDGTPEEEPDIIVGSIENPISVSEFRTKVDALINFDDVEEKKTVTDSSTLFFVKAKVTSSSAFNEYSEINFLNLVDCEDSSLAVTGYYAVIDSSITENYSAENSLKGREVVVKGYGALYRKNDAKTYELAKKDNDHKPTVVKVFEEEEVPGMEYGSLENPLTISQAMASIDLQNPTTKKLYVTGTVASNEAYSSQYGNINRIFITDGQNQMVVYRCGTFPQGYDGTAITQNSIKGMTLVVSGYGEIFQGTTYELTSPEIHSITGDAPQPVDIDNYGTADAPLTISEAMAVIDLQDPTEQDLFVTGVVKSNTAWNSQYNNCEIVITDNEHDFTLYRAGTFPDGFATSSITANSLAGKRVVASGTGKTYSGTYELDAGCKVLSIAENIVAVSSVSVTPATLELQVGQQYQLTAEVLPADATNKAVAWSSSADAKATVSENGVVTAAEAGEATITCTTADGGLTDTCVVTVTEATKEMVYIEIRGTAKAEYTEGESYSAEGLSVYGIYNDQSEDDITALVEWQISKATAEVGDDEITITATYGNFSDNKVVAVTVAEAKGTEEHPYSVSEAYAIFQGLADGENSEEFYFEGYIDSDPAPTISGGRGRFYLTDGVCSTHMYVYNANNTQNTNALTIDEIPVGAKALVRGAVKNYQGGFQVCYVSNVAQCQLVKAVEAPVITSVGAVTGPEEVSVNGTVNPANVTVEVVYSGIVHSTVHAATATGDFSQAGQATVQVTIDGWNEALSFTINVVSGTVLTETEVYKLDGTVTGGTNGYATASDIAQNGISWDVYANTTMNPWRFGGKGAQVRTCESRAAVSSDDITKVVVTTGTANATVNSISLRVGTSQGASDISEITKTTGLTSASLEFARPDNTSWAGRYFTIVFDVTCADGSNQYIQLISAQFFAMK